MFNNLKNNVCMCVPGPLGGSSFWVSEEGFAGLEVIILVSLLGSIVENRLQKTETNQLFKQRHKGAFLNWNSCRINSSHSSLQRS